MRTQPSYLKHEQETSTALILYIPTVVWTFIILLAYLITLGSAEPKSPLQPKSISPWITSTSEKLETIRKLTLHLARDYQAVEFLADTRVSAAHLSDYWSSFQNKHPYIEQIGITEKETGDQFFISQRNAITSPLLSEAQSLNFLLQTSLLNNDDVLFYNYVNHEKAWFFRFSTPVHYEDLRLGHLHIDINTEMLLASISEELSPLGLKDAIIMLDKEGKYVASSSQKDWSIQTALSQEISYYYPQMWEHMNSGLSGVYSNYSQHAAYSKLDIPWYEEQIKYFYLIQLSNKPSTYSNKYWHTILLILWLAGLGMLTVTTPHTMFHSTQHK
jgi:hypothetical protein